MKRILLVLITLGFCNVADAQFSLGKSVGQQYVESAVKQGAFIVKQSFQVKSKDSGEIYGYKGEKFFGIQYSVGVMIDGGEVLITGRAAEPWAYDSNYIKYKEEYDGIMYTSEFALLSDVSTYDTLTISDGNVVALVDGEVYHAVSPTFGGKGLVVDPELGEKNGWVVWVYTKGGTDVAEGATVECSAYRLSVNVEKKGQKIDIEKPESVGNVIGGFYVVPSFSKVGTIEFHICGMLTDSDSKWQICTPFVGYSPLSISYEPELDTSIVAVEDAQGEKVEDGLTPIDDNEGDNRGKKKKKNK